MCALVDVFILTKDSTELSTDRKSAVCGDPNSHDLTDLESVSVAMQGQQTL